VQSAKKSAAAKVSKTDNMVAVLKGLGVYEDIISAAFNKSVAVHATKPAGKKRGPKAKKAENKKSAPPQPENKK
jgi:hypothetical protein